MTDLELATSDELIDELAKRHETLVILAIRNGKTSDTNQERLIWWAGGCCTAIGLCEVARRLMLSSCADEMNDDNE